MSEAAAKFQVEPRQTATSNVWWLYLSFLRRSPTWVPYLYIAPTILLLATFIYWPLVFTGYLSTVRWNFVSDVKLFVGSSNYLGLFDSSLFHAAIENTTIYILASIPLKVLIPLPIAVFIWSMNDKFGNIYKSIIFMPTLLSFVVVSIAFGWLLNPYLGLPSTLLNQIGLSMPNLLQDSNSAIWAILGVSTWKAIGFHVLIYLAGLYSIDRQYIEAMRLDGASDWRMFRHLIWPLLTPTTFFVFITTVIFSLNQVFTPIDILTEGGPSNGTTNLFYMVYQYAFLTFNTGFAAAGAVILFILLGTITIIKIRIVEKWVHYR